MPSWMNQTSSFQGKMHKGVKQPHYDPLVILLKIENFNVHRVLIDNGSSVDIIYLPTFWQI